MNEFVKLYIRGLSTEREKTVENIRFWFVATAKVIAMIGTIDDLKALVDYYELEMEEMKRE